MGDIDYKKLLEGIDWERLRQDTLKERPYDSTSPTSKANLASRVKMGASFDRFNVLTQLLERKILNRL